MTTFPPVRNLADIEALECVPLHERIDDWNANVWVRRGLALDPTKVALQYFVTADPAAAPEEVTYATLARQAVQAANLFYKSGVRPTDGVIYLLPTMPELYVTLLAGLEAGIVCGLNCDIHKSSFLPVPLRLCHCTPLLARRDNADRYLRIKSYRHRTLEQVNR